MPRSRLTAAVLGTADPHGLARFYQRLLGWPIRDDEDDWEALRPADSGTGLSFQLEAACALAEEAGARPLGRHEDDDEIVRPRGSRRPPRSASSPTGESDGRAADDSLTSAPVADLPALPEGLAARPLSADDVAAVAALVAASEQVDDTGEYPDAEDLTEWWTGWDMDFARDGVAVTDGSGLVVAFATALAPRNFRGTFNVYLEGRVRPDQRGKGIGRALLDWQLGRGAEIHAERHPEAPGKLTVPVPEAMTSLESLVKGAGLSAERWYRQMQRPLTDLPDAQAVPGVELVPFTWDRDDEIRCAHNAAFTEHHGSAERDVAAWQTMFTGQRAFRPELSVLALEDGVVVGYLLAYVYEADSAATGVRETHFGQIGVLPPARGRGLASALIGAALRTGAAHDCERAGLEVDADNVTGALRLYEKLGFATTRLRTSWSRSLPELSTG